LLLISTILFMCIAELTARVLERTYFIDTRVYLQRAKPSLHRISETPGLGYELIPKASLDEGFYSINSKGLRDREFKIPKPENVFRIIVLGDSVTFGTEYPVEKTYPKILETFLNLKAQAPLKYEVLNAGVCAYNATQKYLFLKTKLLDYVPDMVIYQFINDDYYRNAVILPNVEKKSQLHAVISIGEYFLSNFPKVVPLPDNLDRWLMRRSGFYRFASKTIYDGLAKQNPEEYPPQAYRFAGYADIAQSLEPSKKVFQEFYALSNAAGFEFILLLAPELDNKDTMDEWIRTGAREKFGFKIIDLFGLLKARGTDLKTLRIVPHGHTHFNEYAHELVAELVADWLKVNCNF